MSGSQPFSAPMWASAPDNPLRALRRRIRRQPRLRQLRRAVFAHCVRVLLAFVRHAPRSAVSRLLGGLTALSWRLLPRERWVALRQLESALPELDAAAREQLARRSLQVMTENLIDGIRGDRGVWMLRDDEARLRALAGEESPLLLLCAHLGAWELLGCELARRLPRFAVIAAEPHNGAVGRILRESRGARGLQSFDREREALAAARFLRRGGVLALLADHRSRAVSIPAPWFGREAPTLRAPYAFARRFGALVLAVGIRRDGAGHRIVLGRELRYTGQDARSFAADCNAALQQLILESPSEWTWIHDRTGEAESA